MSDPLVRHWDPKGECEGAVLRVYKYWCLEVSWVQHTIGAFIIFCRREGVERETELTDAELLELRDVKRDMQGALAAHPRFVPDRFNYWQMGNAFPQLHYHGIPRYKDLRVFGNQPWFDDSYGYLPHWSRFHVDRALVDMLVSELKPHLPT